MVLKLIIFIYLTGFIFAVLHFANFGYKSKENIHKTPFIFFILVGLSKWEYLKYTVWSWIYFIFWLKWK